MSVFATELTDRAALRVSGPQAGDFLQNLLTQNMARCVAGSLHMAALLTPQGKLLFDFLIFGDKTSFLLDCEAAQADALVKRLLLYKLRADINIEKLKTHPLALWQSESAPPERNGFLPDPRHALLGLRGFHPAPKNAEKRGLADWHAHRVRLGVPQGAEDMPSGKTFPLEFGLAQMGAIDFQKGCFIGQEVTSRVHRRGVLRKRLWPVSFAKNPAPSVGTPIMEGARQVGEIVAVQKRHALALLRDDAESMTADGQSFTIGEGLFGKR